MRTQLNWRTFSLMSHPHRQLTVASPLPSGVYLVMPCVLQLLSYDLDYPID